MCSRSNRLCYAYGNPLEPWAHFFIDVARHFVANNGILKPCGPTFSIVYYNSLKWIIGYKFRWLITEKSIYFILTFYNFRFSAIFNVNVKRKKLHLVIISLFDVIYAWATKLHITKRNPIIVFLDLVEENAPFFLLYFLSKRGNKHGVYALEYIERWQMSQYTCVYVCELICWKVFCTFTCNFLIVTRALAGQIIRQLFFEVKLANIPLLLFEIWASKNGFSYLSFSSSKNN